MTYINRSGSKTATKASKACLLPCSSPFSAGPNPDPKPCGSSGSRIATPHPCGAVNLCVGPQRCVASLSLLANGLIHIYVYMHTRIGKKSCVGDSGQFRSNRFVSIMHGQFKGSIPKSYVCFCRLLPSALFKSQEHSNLVEVGPQESL